MKKFIVLLNSIIVLTSAVWAVSPQTAYALEADGQASETSVNWEEADLQELSEEAQKALQEILTNHEVMALVYLDSTQALLSEPSFDSEVLAQLPTGHTVFLRDVTVDEDAVVWVSVETYFEGQTYRGNIPRYYLACADKDFLQWEEMYLGDRNADIAFYALDRSVSEDIEAFPDSYKEALYALKEQHPNWIFVRMDTDLDWGTVIDNEMKNDRSLIYYTYPAYVRGECYDDGKWYYPTREILEYYMDPRNGLKEDAIFQFELLTYNEDYHTQDAVEAFLNNTFMNSEENAPGTDMTFAQIFWAVGAEQNISPFHLASRVYQEQGDGKSALISGNYPGYEGYYNYFNVKASGTTTQQIIERGLAYAKSENWNSAYFSILGGGKIIAANYISKGQDTIYLQKYNVNRNSTHALYTHQYMQNIVAPTSEGRTVKNMYQKVGSLDNTFVFKIPVYLNAPEKACPMPTEESTKVQNGWYEENGNYYWYENGIRQGLEGRGKEIYDPSTDAWYWLDANENGKKAVNKDVYQESYAGEYADREDGTGKWARYNENGQMIKGEDYRYGGWYRFDGITGAMVKGWYTTSDGKKYYYDKSTGQMVHGYVTIDGSTLYFDDVTGVFADCVWVWIDGNAYWFEGGIRQGLEGRGKEIYDPGTDAWYWLDSVENGKRAVSKDVYQESDGGKWVRYDANGHMIKGWDSNESGTYYFDLVTGAMAKGSVTIDGVNYYFNPDTGIKQ